MTRKRNIAVFASGEGTNAEVLFRYFDHHEEVQVRMMLSNNSSAPVIKKAEKYNIPVVLVTKEQWQEGSIILAVLKALDVDFIVLAGFLWLIPEEIILAYPHKIINIHPALLPQYGGKGMYGLRVHEKVLENKDEVSGITIHYVNRNYDEGEIILQKTIPIDLVHDTPESIAAKVRKLEHVFLPKITEDLVLKKPEPLPN